MSGTSATSQPESEGSPHRPGARRAGAILRAVAAGALLAVFGVLAAAACGDDDDNDKADSGSANTVKATQVDGKITLDTSSSTDGDVEFDIHNSGKLTHEFVVVKTDLAEDKLPLVADGSKVDEEGSGVDVVGEREDISPGSDVELSLDNLAAGKYVVICNVPGHYGLGMHAAFTVE